ncbi:hypothetical protein F2P81_007812 [Scophthalmus maximus]|uniref:Uncharacterized protein n=1 Tax=Scophthalmus maximus TaxID=52904 RepID=A0A6A4T0M5_SCOMX|nr:hypothetical protein F2P81_007812 [Scophthalmus maximus]
MRSRCCREDVAAHPLIPTYHSSISLLRNSLLFLMTHVAVHSYTAPCTSPSVVRDMFDKRLNERRTHSVHCNGRKLH